MEFLCRKTYQPISVVNSFSFDSSFNFDSLSSLCIQYANYSLPPLREESGCCDMAASHLLLVDVSFIID